VRELTSTVFVRKANKRLNRDIFLKLILGMVYYIDKGVWLKGISLLEVFVNESLTACLRVKSS